MIAFMLDSNCFSLVITSLWLTFLTPFPPQRRCQHRFILFSVRYHQYRKWFYVLLFFIHFIRGSSITRTNSSLFDVACYASLLAKSKNFHCFFIVELTMEGISRHLLTVVCSPKDNFIHKGDFFEYSS